MTYGIISRSINVGQTETLLVGRQHIINSSGYTMTITTNNGAFISAHPSVGYTDGQVNITTAFDAEVNSCVPKRIRNWITTVCKRGRTTKIRIDENFIAILAENGLHAPDVWLFTDIIYLNPKIGDYVLPVVMLEDESFIVKVARTQDSLYGYHKVLINPYEREDKYEYIPPHTLLDTSKSGKYMESMSTTLGIDVHTSAIVRGLAALDKTSESISDLRTSKLKLVSSRDEDIDKLASNGVKLKTSHDSNVSTLQTAAMGSMKNTMKLLS